MTSNPAAEQVGMLILTRGPQESILIGEDIEVRILEINGNQVRIGIAAPKNVAVLREHVANRVYAGAEQDRAGAKALE